jgi:hypothetical protein
MRGKKAAVRRERFGETAHHQIDLASEALCRNHAAASGPHGAEVVRHIHKQRRTPRATSLLKCRKVWRIGLHGEHPLGDHHDAVAGVPGADRLQPRREVFCVIVDEMMDLRGGRRCPLLQAGMAQIVHDDVVARTHERGNGAVSGRPSGRIKRHVLKP